MAASQGCQSALKYVIGVDRVRAHFARKRADKDAADALVEERANARV